MASSFMDSLKNLADSISSNRNCFTWDSAIRKFQYGIAGITLAALSIFETTNTMQCSTPSPSFPEYYYASSYCREATWYYITNKNETKKEPYDDWLRDFKWYILIPPAITVIAAVLYGALVDSFVGQVLKSAGLIRDIWDARMDDSVSGVSTIGVDRTLLNMAIRARDFAQTHMHYKAKINCCGCSIPSKRYTECTTLYGSSDPEASTEHYLLETMTSRSDDIREEKATDKVGHRTALYYQLYLGVCLCINVIAVVFINPYYFWFPNAIACKYRKEDLTFHWSICSVPGHRYSRVALIIIMLNHLIGALVAILSLVYLKYHIPAQISTATIALDNYTRNTKQQFQILQCWRKRGKEKIGTFTETTKFILALIYQNIDRLLCYRLVLAMIDIEKDNEAITSELPLLIEQIVEINRKKAGLDDEDREELVSEIRETIMNPVGIEQVKDQIQMKVLMKSIAKFLDNPIHTDELFKSQLLLRITGVQLPKISKGAREKFTNVLKEAKESEFENSIEFYRFLSAIYDLSKSKCFFSLMKPMEIGKLCNSEALDNISDNGHETISGQPFDATKAFDMSGFCWRSSDATAYNWIRRKWDKEHVISLVAIQGSHVEPKSTPIHFNITAKIENDEKNSWEMVSESYQSFDWLKDEWRVFLLATTNHKEYGVRMHPCTKELQINIFKNSGANFFEIQKIKIFGKIVN